jgi:putative ABC transport system permease protein
MLKNYLKTALRNLWGEKGSTVINLAGLTLGITSSLVLFLLIAHHRGFDQFHSKKDRIYRVVTESAGNNGPRYTPGIPPVFPDAFRNDFHEAESITFTSYRADALITIPQPAGEPRKYEERKGVTYADPYFLAVFDRKVLYGNAAKSLDDPNEAMISRKSALKYFGKEEALGEVLKFDNREYKVTAILEDYPPDTDFPFDVMLSYSTIKQEHEKEGWGGIWSDEQCYFTLRKNVSIHSIESRMEAFYNKYNQKENKNHRVFKIQPLSEIHFDDRYGNYNYSTISREMLLALTVIAVFLMLTACINFVNLTTAEAIKRSKEVGIRKALGSSRGQLVRQFLGETTLVTVVAVMAALVLASVALGFLNPFLDVNLALDFLSLRLWAFLLLVVVGVAVLSGLYPSFVVSGFKAVEALKNQISNRNSSGYALRRILVVFQFFISQALIIGTLVLIRQMDYFQHKDLGFRRDAVVVVPIPERETPATGDGSSKMRALRDDVARLSGVEGGSLSSTPPSSGSTSTSPFTIEGNDENYTAQMKTVDGNYVPLYELELVAGHNIGDRDTAQGFLVNERLAATVGYKNPHDIVGKMISVWGKRLSVVGVVKDFHTVSLRSPIEATIMLNRIRNYETLSLKLDPVHLQETIHQVQHRWEIAYPEFIFSYQFLDEQIREFYEQEKRNSILLSVFTTMAIFIGCLGLFGLATFMANQKTKEIGVRKVLGASVESIVVLFSKEYLKLILVGFVLAAPLAGYVMNRWLDEFAYKIQIGPAIFLMGLLATLVIAMITVGYRSFRAAVVNPAQSLKSE